MGIPILLGGCAAKPSTTNIKLRVRIQALQDEIAVMQTQHTGDLATIAALKSASASTQPIISGSDADALFTVHGIRLGRTTGGADLDPNLPGDDGLKIYLTPVDETQDYIKAAGSITIEAFDLAAEKPALGKWSFTATEAKQFWNGQAMLYEYIIPCPWQTRPAHADVTVKVTFVDSLTGRSFTEQKLVKVSLAAQ